jgi:SAM-dependent methyltransferase
VAAILPPEGISYHLTLDGLLGVHFSARFGFIMQTVESRYARAQYRWQQNEARNYTHPLDVQIFADLPLFRLLGNVNGQHILDIGCGNGYLLRKLWKEGAHVVGIDVSDMMVHEARMLEEARSVTPLCVASADCLPFSPSVYDAAICSLTINNFPSADITKRAFREAARVLKPGGMFVITLPHPHTLDSRSLSRWTEWEEGQSQENLVPGEGFKRQIMGKDGTMISIVNYYWPREALINFATRAGLELDGAIEETVSRDEMSQYSDELDPVCVEVPFFLVMRFICRLPSR